MGEMTQTIHNNGGEPIHSASIAIMDNQNGAKDLPQNMQPPLLNSPGCASTSRKRKTINA